MRGQWPECGWRHPARPHRTRRRGRPHLRPCACHRQSWPATAPLRTRTDRLRGGLDVRPQANASGPVHHGANPHPARNGKTEGDMARGPECLTNGSPPTAYLTARPSLAQTDVSLYLTQRRPSAGPIASISAAKPSARAGPPSQRQGYSGRGAPHPGRKG